MIFINAKFTKNEKNIYLDIYLASYSSFHLRDLGKSSKIFSTWPTTSSWRRSVLRGSLLVLPNANYKRSRQFPRGFPVRLIISQRDFIATHSLHSVCRRVLRGATITNQICVQFKILSCSAWSQRRQPNLVQVRGFSLISSRADQDIVKTSCYNHLFHRLQSNIVFKNRPITVLILFF